MSAIVTWAITAIASGPLAPVSSSAGSSTAADPDAISTA